MSSAATPVDGEPELESATEPALVDRYDQRITVDYDGKDFATWHEFELEAIRVWHNLQDVADRVDVHISSGQHGLHFVAWFEDDLEFYEQVAVRRANCDDPRRVDMDVQRWLQLGGRFSDVLFQQKGDRSTTKERRFRDVHDALDYIGGLRSDYKRVKSVAIDGHKGDPELARRAER